MQTSTIRLQDKTLQNFSSSQLEKFINSEDFQDVVLWYQMIKWETWETESFSSFKSELWL